MRQVYISADGIVMPCCWIGNVPFVNDYFDFHADNIDLLSLDHHDFDTIIKSNQFKSISETWDTDNPFKACLKFCHASKIDDSTVEMQGNNQMIGVKI